MENLNAEQVKSDLECFHQRILDTHLADDIRDGEMMAILDALALINKQETEYNELYELLQSYKADSEAYRSYSKTLEKENEGLKTLLDESYDTQNSLTEENEYLKTQLTATEARAESRKESDLEDVLELRLKVEELTEENDKLYRFVDDKIQECEKWKRRLKNECEYTEKITVRKMQERLEAHCVMHYWGGRYVPEYMIDQIAKEMLEGKK